MLSRRDVRPQQTKMLVDHGFLPISIDYRLCPETTLLEGPMNDVADALAWIENDLPKLQLKRSEVSIDPKKIVCIGWSSGGQLAMSLAWTSQLRGIRPPNAILAFYCATDYEDDFWTKPNTMLDATGSQNSSSTDMGGVWSGISDQALTSYNVPPTHNTRDGWLAPTDARSRLALYMNAHGRTLHVLLNGLDPETRAEPSSPHANDVKAASPLWHIRHDKYRTPTFIIHPRKDDLIPWQQAKRTGQALEDAGVDGEVRIVDEVPHLFDLHRKWAKHEQGRKAIEEGYKFLCQRVGLQRGE